MQQLVYAIQFKSSATPLEGNTFTESGTITFGDKGNRLLFKSVGTGWMAPGPQDGVSQGAISWVIEGGEGQFAGAKGVITSNFTIGSDGEVSDYQLGVLYLA